MPDAVLVALLVAAACVPLWLLRHPRPLSTARTGADPRSVSVVVPARNEEQSLPALLDSLRGLQLREVVVVDDDSIDRTAAVADAGGGRVVAAPDRPDGWTGKAWACHTGAAATTGELLLFLDADTVLSRGSVEALLELQRTHGGLVSVQPHHRVVRPYEQLSAYFNAVALLASAAFTGRPTGSGAGGPMAFGPCLLTSRDDYERVGGHRTVRGEVLDDVRLARAYDAAGLPVTCATGAGSVSMRSYPGGLAQLVSGWTKNIASGASAAGPLASLATVLWICGHHVVAVGALTAVVDGLTRTDLWWALAWLVVALQLRSILRVAGTFRWWAWALFPLPLLAFDLVFARSALLTGVRRSVRWRGRPVDVGRARSGTA